MERKIRVGIVGYGNLGRGAQIAVEHQNDMELVGIFSRRKLENIANAYPIDALEKMEEDIDVLILCGGSATDLPEMTPKYARKYNVVDSYDTHARIHEHFLKVDSVAKDSGKVAIISIGWDPGLFSLQRLLGDSIIRGQIYILG